MVRSSPEIFTFTVPAFTSIPPGSTSRLPCRCPSERLRYSGVGLPGGWLTNIARGGRKIAVIPLSL